MCDSLVAMKESTRDGYTIFAKNSDRAVNEPQYFTYVPAADHKEGERLRCTFIEIEQVRHTNAMVLSKPSWIWGGEIGVNEHGVCIGNESIYSKETQKEPALMGMDLVRIGLERAATARSAIQEITKVLEAYGQGGNCSFDAEFYYDNSFLIADTNEGWVLETAGRYWAAKQVRGVCSISNYMSIGCPDIIHKQAIQHAKDCGWDIGVPFDFTKAYINWSNPGNYNGMVRKVSGARILDKYSGDVTVENMMEVLRSHTTDMPWTKGNFSICKHAVGIEGPHQTTNSMIVVLVPDDILIFGTGMSIPCISLYKPFWFDTFSDKVVFSYDHQEQAMESWIMRERLNRAIIDGRIDEIEYKTEMEQIQVQWLKQVHEVSKSGRRLLCEQIAHQEEQFIRKWIEKAEGNAPRPKGDQAFQKHWADKNAQLGRNRTIAI